MEKGRAVRGLLGNESLLLFFRLRVRQIYLTLVIISLQLPVYALRLLDDYAEPIHLQR